MEKYSFVIYLEEIYKENEKVKEMLGIIGYFLDRY